MVLVCVTAENTDIPLLRGECGIVKRVYGYTPRLSLPIHLYLAHFKEILNNHINAMA